jgi:hypothetical protein
MPIFFKNKRIAGYIRTGLTMDVDETQTTWLHQKDSRYAACALGMAIVGKLGLWKGHLIFIETLLRNGGDEIQTVSDILEVEPLLVEEINKIHMLGVPAVEIAECLEFEEGDDQFDSSLAAVF